ncbi:MAG TPA: SURF1 family protein [Propionibacterium sp.]|nr:SURF1 family protein [Propionibacterium sp.]
MSTRLKQFVILTVGVVGALVMVFLGLWQMQVFVDKGNKTVEDRAAQPAVAFEEYLGDDARLRDIYGKQVTIAGTYLPDHQVLVPTDGSYRVLAALEVSDGRILPVVRGLAPSEDAIPAPPPGERHELGLFLPGEGDVKDDRGINVEVPDGQLASVRMPALAQEWTNLVPGFVTLGEGDAADHGLAHAPVSLPTGEGSAQNSGYALQWWVFAAFGLGMAIKLAHSLGVRERKAQEAAALEATRKDATA